MEDSFEIFVSAAKYPKRKVGRWAATTSAKARKPYTVEFGGDAKWTSLEEMLLRAATKALADLEVDGRQVTIYLPRQFDESFGIATINQIASGQSPDSAGSGPVWERFLFQVQRHEVTFALAQAKQKNYRETLDRLIEGIGQDGQSH